MIFAPLVSSSFTGIDETPLSDGAVWTATSGIAAFNRSANTAVPSDVGSDDSMVYTGASFNAAQYSRANLTVTGTGGGGRGIGLSVLRQTAVITGYRFVIDHAASNNAALHREVNNVFASLVQWTQAFTDGDQFTLAVLNEVLYVYDNTGTLVQAYSDVGGGVGTTGKPGLAFSSSETSASVDNWEGGNFLMEAPVMTRGLFGFTPARYPMKRNKLRPSRWAPTLNDANLPPVLDEYTQTNRLLFGWSPMRRPMVRRMKRATIPAIIFDTSVTPDTGSLILTSFAPTVSVSLNQIVTPGTAALALSAFAPSVLTPVLVTPSIGTLTLSPFAPSVLTPVLVTPGTASLSLTSFAPSVSITNALTVIPATTALTLTTFAPSVLTPVLVTPALGVLTLTTFAPTVLTPVLMTPGPAALTLSTFAPLVLTPRLATPSAAALVLTSFAPTILVSANQVVTPGPSALVLSTFAPLIAVSGIQIVNNIVSVVVDVTPKSMRELSVTRVTGTVAEMSQQVTRELSI